MDNIEITNDNSDVTTNSKQIALLKAHFPQCFDKDGNFMMQRMEEIVGDEGLELSKESYSLNWLGKSYARLLANENSHTLLKEDKEHNAQEPHNTSENLLIKGDNLEVLKHLSNAYSEAIKMIYIDPPYNTGGDGFVYQDDRKFTPEELSRLAGVDVEEAERILEFTQSKANSHSAWLTFMYPRLYVARHLLKDDGVIFISIDDNESAQLKLLCDEVFGEENFIALVPTIMNLKGNQDSFGFADTHEYFFCYGKNKDQTSLGKFEIDEDELEKEWDEDEFGPFKKADGLRRTGDDASRIKRPKGWFPVFITNDNHIYTTDNDKPISEDDFILYPINDDGEELSWSWSKTKIKKDNHNLIVTIARNGSKTIYKKQRPEIGDMPTKKPKSFFYKAEYSTSTATTQFKKMIGKKVFKSPKPVPFIMDLITIGLSEKDIILDFFVGSGTTAHALMEINAIDNGNRKYISVQLAEKINEKENKIAYDYVKNELKKEPSIFEITKARIQKAADKITDEYPEYIGDLGFRIFETIPMFEGYQDDIDSLQDDTTLFDGSTLSDDELDTLLTTWRVHDGMTLTEKLEEVVLGSYKAHYGNGTVYMMGAGFQTDDLKSFIKKLDEEKEFEPSKVVLFGYNFKSKHQREFKEAVNTYLNRKSIELDLVIRY